MAIHPLPLPGDRPLELGLLTDHDPYDRRAFSGTVFFAARALAGQAGLRLRLVGWRRPHLADRVLRGRRRLRLSPEAFDGLDAVVGLVASAPLARLAAMRPELPFLHVTDATPAFLRTEYGWAVPAGADIAEARVAERAAFTVYSSAAMAGRAARDLDLPRLSPVVLPFGVNFDRPPPQRPQKPPLGRLNLLFVGLDWERKGGDIAVAALERLRATGREAHLTVVGRCPQRHLGHPDITRAGLLNKNRPAEAARLSRLYAEAHLLVLPTRADCAPMVVAEAMAHGVPVLATGTGGIAAQIGSAGAGRVLPPYTSPALWAEEIAAMTADRTAYELMSDASFDRAATMFSWSAWASGIEALARRAAVLGGLGAASRPRLAASA